MNKSFKLYKYKKTLILSTLVTILIASFSIVMIINQQSKTKQNKILATKQENIRKLADEKAVTAAKVSQLANKSSEKNKNYLALEAYKKVLQNKAEFFSTDNKRNVYLNDFLTNEEIFGAIFKVTHFTVLDMVGDKVPEVVLELSVGNNNPICYEVLHYMNGAVHGYNIVYRGLERLKTDGTFWGSSGAADNKCGKLKFSSKAYETDILGYSQSSQGDANLTISYFINNKPVTEESFNSFSKKQDGKKDVVWHEFSEKNIATELSLN